MDDLYDVFVQTHGPVYADKLRGFVSVLLCIGLRLNAINCGGSGRFYSLDWRAMERQEMQKQTNIGTTDVQLDFIFSNALDKVENGIANIVRGLLISKMALCIALANVKQKALYRQASIASFRDYLRSSRINLNYQTAHEYSKIGEVYLRHRDLLQLIDFREECGLKKLLLLDCALKRHERGEVFSKLVDSSYREFKRFAGIDRSASVRADSQPEAGKSTILMQEDDECIFLMPSGKEVVWFNTDLGQTLLTPKSFRRLKKTVFSAIMQFLNELDSRKAKQVIHFPRPKASKCNKSPNLLNRE